MDKSKRSGGLGWLVLAIVLEIPAMLLALVIFAFLVVSSGIKEDPLFSELLVPIVFVAGALPVWLVFDRAYVRKNVPERGRIYFTILMLFPLLASGGLIWWATVMRGVDQKAQAAQAAQGIKVLLADIRQAEDGAQAEKGGYTVSFHPGLPGDAGRLDNAAREFLATVSKANALSNASGIPLDLPYVLEPKQLAGPHGLANARARLAESRNEILEHSHTTDGAYAKFRIALSDAKIDPALKRELLADHDRRAAEGRAIRDKATQQVIAVTDEMGRTLNDLERDQEKWRVIDNRFYFDDKISGKRFAAHFSRINLIEHQIAQARR